MSIFRHDSKRGSHPITPKKGIESSKFKGANSDIIKVQNAIIKHAQKTAKSNDHLIEVFNTDAKSDVDMFFTGIKDALKKKNPNIVMTSDLLEARPFQENTKFLVSFEDRAKDRILKQFYVTDKKGILSVEEL